jgi:hypothetical protein
MVNGYWEIGDWEPGHGVNEFRITNFDGFVKSRFDSLREHFGGPSDVQLKC